MRVETIAELAQLRQTSVTHFFWFQRANVFWFQRFRYCYLKSGNNEKAVIGTI